MNSLELCENKVEIVLNVISSIFFCAMMSSFCFLFKLHLYAFMYAVKEKFLYLQM